MKRTISVLIAAALLAFLFAACGQTPALGEPETPPSGADAKKAGGGPVPRPDVYGILRGTEQK